MKTNIRTLALLLVLVATSVISPKQASAQQDYVSLQVFYDELSPYGEWIESAQYGYVWIPDVGPDFMPYSSEGQWILTDYGWTWVSGYEWGWAPFHYGRWDYDNYYGWLWVPDYEWGPSWVTWRSASGYYGWQPMRPGISISLSFGNDYYNNYNDYWMFVSDRDFQRPNVSRYYVNQTNRDRIVRNSTVINNTYIDNSRNTTYVSGPARDNVQRTTGKRVNSVVIRENNRPGQNLKNGQLQIYRPNVRKNTDPGQKPAPTRITSREDVKRPSERNAAKQQRDASPANNSRQQQRQNTINQQTIDKGNAQREQQQKVNQSENSKRQQRQNDINQQNIDKGNAQREQQQKVNQSENNRQQQQRQNDINQQNIDKGNAQREQQQKVNQSENNREQKQQNIDKNNAQPAQQQKVNAPKNNVREQRQINRQEKSNRSKQEKENKNR